MMEKFYIVTEECGLHKECLDYEANVETIRKTVNCFTDEHGIESKEYYATDERLYIVPTNEDINKFRKYLGAELTQGLRPFKKASRINKDWVRVLLDNNLEVKRRPYPIIYFDDCFGTHTSRLFESNGIAYTSMRLSGSRDFDFKTPKGMIEIKASEFYKVIEDHNDKIKAKRKAKEETHE